MNIDDGSPSTRIKVPADKVCWVIGTKGAVIKDIQRKTGTRMQVENPDKNDEALNLRSITIVGTEEQQQAAIAEVNRVIGTTAGMKEFKEDDFSKSNSTGYMPGMTPLNSMFSSSMDFETMQKYMEMQIMNNPHMFGMQPQAGGMPMPPPGGSENHMPERSAAPASGHDEDDSSPPPGFE